MIRSPVDQGQGSGGESKEAGPIQGLSLHPYRLGLSRPWKSTRGSFAARFGWLVRAHCAGITGYGDCPPLPEAGTEQPETAAATLAHWRNRLVGLDMDKALMRLSEEATGRTPAADCAVECALSDLASRLSGVRLRRWLGASPGCAVSDWVPVNGNLGAVDGLTSEDVRRACAEGTTVLKLKVGLGDPAMEMAGISALARTLPTGVRLRLDANGAWDGDTARRCIARLCDLPIECLEEPLAIPDPDALARLQALTPFALALDESLPRLLAKLDPASLPVRRAILKPAVIGGLRRTLNLAAALRAQGIEVVVTSLVESAAGLWPSAQLAATIGSAIPHGLATAGWLTSDLGPPPIPHRGGIRLTAVAGSGFDPHPPGPNHE